VRASKGPLSGNLGAHVRSIEKRVCVLAFQSVGLSCMDISELALACALKNIS